MPYLIELLLFCLPFALFFLWRRLNPALESADPRLLPLAVAGLVLAGAAAIWLGLSRETGPGSVYVPAELAPDGTIRPGHLDPRP
jgi:hypothetical protein